MCAQLGGRVEPSTTASMAAPRSRPTPLAFVRGHPRARPRGRLDEPRRPDRRPPPGFAVDRLPNVALRRHRRRGPPLLRRPVPPRGRSTPPSARGILQNFLFRSPASPATGRCTPTATRRSRASAPRSATAGVICGLSGGVDSSVAALLLHEAIGDQLTCVFVDTGLLRFGEAKEVVDLFRGHFNIPLIHVDAGDRFLGALAGVSDPEAKRKTIGRPFIDVFDARGARSSATPLPRPGHPLPRRDRERRLRRPRRSPSSPTTTSAACPSA